MTDFLKLSSKCLQLSSMLSYTGYLLYQLWYILHISFDTWGYPRYIPCIWHLKIHILGIWHAYPIDMTFHKKIIEHICVISIVCTRIKILILYIYLVYPTPTFCLQKWVEPGRWCRKSGLLRLVSVCLVSSVISWMPKPGAAHIRYLPMCVLALTWIVGKALVRHSWLSVSSGGSKQVQLSGPQERASACNEVPLWRRPPSCPHKNIYPAYI